MKEELEQRGLRYIQFRTRQMTVLPISLFANYREVEIQAHWVSEHFYPDSLENGPGVVTDSTHWAFQKHFPQYKAIMDDFLDRLSRK